MSRLAASALLFAAALAIAGEAAAALPTGSILVLHDGRGFPLPDCPRCQVAHVLDDVGEGRPVDGLILAGHSGFGRYLGLSPDELANRLARIVRTPAFLVVDSCFGAQAELLLALARAGFHPRIVIAVASPVRFAGLDYGGLLLGERVDPAALAERLVADRDAAPTLVEGTDSGALTLAIEAAASAVRRCQSLERFVSVMPNLLPITVPGARGPLLVHVPPEGVPADCYSAGDADRVALARSRGWIGLGAASLIAIAGLLLRRRA